MTAFTLVMLVLPAAIVAAALALAAEIGRRARRRAVRRTRDFGDRPGGS